MSGSDAQDTPFHKAVLAALQKISLRPRSVQEIRDVLAGKGFDQSLSERVIDHLKQLNYLNDRDFARYWVEGRTARRPAGRRVVERELQDKGVASDAIQEAAAARQTEGADLEIALALAHKRRAQMGTLDARVAKRRLYSYLVRRGFDFDVVYKVIEQVCA